MLSNTEAVSALSPIDQKVALLELARVVGARYNSTPRAIVGRLLEEALSTVCDKLIAPSSLILTNGGADFTVGEYQAVEAKQTHVVPATQPSRLARGQLYRKPSFDCHDWHTMVTLRDGYAFGLLDDAGAVVAALVALGSDNAAIVSRVLCSVAGVSTPEEAKPMSGRTHLKFTLAQMVEALDGPLVYFIHRDQLISRADFQTLFGLNT